MQLQYNSWTQDPGNIMEEGAEWVQEPEDQEVCEVERSSYDRTCTQGFPTTWLPKEDLSILETVDMSK